MEKAKKVTPYLYLCMTCLPTHDEDGNLLGVVTEWRYDNFYSALTAILLGLQVGGPLTGEYIEDTALIIETMFRQSMRTSLSSGRPVLGKWRSTPRGSLAESFARGLGVGWEQAQTLSIEFPSWNCLVQAVDLRGPSVLTELRGWGKITSERVAKFILGGTA